MMQLKRLSRLMFGVCVLSLLLTAGMTFAQDVPAPINTALGRLNQETGGNYVLGSSTAYNYREEVFNGNNLGCGSVASTESGQFRGYAVTFDTDFNGSFEWDIRVSADSQIVIVCQRPTAPQPTSEPGPVLPTATPSACSSFAPVLSIGVQARVLPPEPNILRATPDLRGEYVADIQVGDVVTVLDGPRCTNSYTWWQVDYAGRIGWTVENDGSEYWMELVGAATATTPDETGTGGRSSYIPPVVCDEALPPRLAVDELARVTPGYSNNVRTQPTVSGEKVGEIPGGETLFVQDGPVCADGLTWWKVGYGSFDGWTAEGQDGEYFLQPPSPYTAITSENVGSVAILNSWTSTPLPLVQAGVIGRTQLATISSDGFAGYQRLNPLDVTSGLSFETTSSITSSPPSGEASFQIFPDNSVLVMEVSANDVLVYLPASEFGFTIPGANVVKVQYSVYTPMVATLDDQNIIQIWVVDGTNALSMFTQLFEQPVSDFVFVEGGLLVAHGSSISHFAWADLAFTETFTLDNDIHRSRLAVDRSGTKLAVIGATLPDGQRDVLRVFDLTNGTALYSKLDEATIYASAPVFTLDGSAVAALDTTDGVHGVRFHDSASGDVLGTVEVRIVSELTINHDGTILTAWDSGFGEVHFLGIPTE